MTTLDTESRATSRGRQPAAERVLPLPQEWVDRWTSPSPGRVRSVAQGLGWFSIGLGLSELLAPRATARLIGARRRPFLMRALGVREIASGVGILTTEADKSKGGWVWSRVAGDAMDLALLANGFRSRKTAKSRLAAATLAVIGVTLLDVLCAQRLTAKP